MNKIFKGLAVFIGVLGLGILSGYGISKCRESSDQTFKLQAQKYCSCHGGISGILLGPSFFNLQCKDGTTASGGRPMTLIGCE